jgi:predicted Zn-dependent peptidase
MRATAVALTLALAAGCSTSEPIGSSPGKPMNRMVETKGEAPAPAPAAPAPAAPAPTPAPAAPAKPPAAPATSPSIAPATAPAAPAAARGLLPASEDFRLGNGVRVFLVADHRAPLVDVEVRVAGGSVEDEPGKEGAGDLLATLLGKGAGSRDAQTFHEAVDFVGGTFSTGGARRWLSVDAEFLKADADLEMELVADALQHPTLDAAEFEKEKKLAIDGIRQAKQQPRDIIRLYHACWFFGSHPYGRPTTGDEKSLAALTLDDVKHAAARTLSPSRTWIAVAGDFDAADMKKRIEKRFGEWKVEAPAPAAVPPVVAPKGRGVLLVDFPSSLQTYFRFGQLGFDWKDPDYPARYLANTVLGGRFTSRLNKTLRTDSGLTYGASSLFDDTTQGTFLVATYTQVAKSRETIDMAADVTSKFMAEGLTADEFVSARAFIKGQYAPDNVETAAQQASMILALEFDGVPRRVVDKLFSSLDALTLADVNRVVKQRFPSKDWAWTVIGPADSLRDYLKKFGTVTECKLTDPGFGPSK